MSDKKVGKKDAAKKSDKPQAQKKRFKFFREVFAELKKVTWPSRRSLIVYTSAVLLMTLVMTIILGAWDLGLTQLMNLLLG